MKLLVRLSALSLICATAALTSSCITLRGRTPARGAGCQLRSSDSTLMAGAPLYRECAVDTHAANLTRGQGPMARPAGALHDGCYSAELQFVVDTTGVPEQRTARVLTTNDQSYADAVIATLPTWRYKPALIGSTPVRQIVTEREATAIKVGQMTDPPPSPSC